MVEPSVTSPPRIAASPSASKRVASSVVTPLSSLSSLGMGASAGVGVSAQGKRKSVATARKKSSVMSRKKTKKVATATVSRAATSGTSSTIDDVFYAERILDQQVVDGK